MLKTLTSFCIFIYEIQVTPPSKSLLLRYPHNSVHAGIGVGDNTYHYSYPYGNANSQQRSSNLVASKSNYKLLGNSLFAPCVGIAVIMDEREILQNLQLCGKCHDWAAASLYLISFNKFLSYSIISPLRWISWLLFVTSLLSCFTSGDTYLMIDILHIGSTIFDTLNFSDIRLESNTSASKLIRSYRGYWFWEFFKLIVLLLICFAFVCDHS